MRGRDTALPIFDDIFLFGERGHWLARPGRTIRPYVVRFVQLEGPLASQARENHQ
jgi:hypothetical protein